MNKQVKLEFAAKAQRLSDLRTQIKELTSEADAIRGWFIHLIAEEKSMTYGNWHIMMVERSRVDLNKTALRQALGPELEKFQVHSTYKTLEIRRA